MTIRDIVIQWLNQAIAMDVGEEIYIPAEDKTSRTEAYQRYRKELDIMRQISPMDAAKIRVSTDVRGGKHWVVLKRVAVITPTIAFKKNTSGDVVKISVTTADESVRIERLKKEDGVSILEGRV